MTKFPFPLPERYEPTGDRISGGQGYVYVCNDRYLERKVAIKVMKAKGDGIALEKELRALCEISSRHVAQAYDMVSSKGGTLGLVQEFVSGLSLEEYLEDQKPSPEEYLKILYQIAAGLADIHRHGKVHRDVNPRNLKFDAEKILKILDFGLITDLQIDDETTRARGTEGFLGPEFYATPPVRISKAADTYSYGVTAWLLATGNEIHGSLLEEPPQSHTSLPSFSTINSSIPPEIVSILDATLNPDPRKRPGMDDVAAILARRLLYGRRRALISVGQAQDKHELSEVGKSLRLRSGSDSVTISYDGLAFRVSAVEGDAYINNSRVRDGFELPKSCVVTLGAPYLGAQRTFVAVDTSHPEVLL